MHLSLTQSSLTEQRKQLRRQLRAARRALSPQAQRHAALSLAKQLRQLLPVMRAQSIAAYIAADGEISPDVFTAFASLAGKQIYLPRLFPDTSNRVHFALEQGPLRKNRFGILEPDMRAAVRPAKQLSVVLMPLVGFDRAGNRLGMGGGFYDRSFAFKHQLPASRPLLIGLAHSCQQVDSLPTEAWDTPVDYIVTEREVIRCRA